MYPACGRSPLSVACRRSIYRENLQPERLWKIHTCGGRKRVVVHGTSFIVNNPLRHVPFFAEDALLVVSFVPDAQDRVFAIP